jgi:hypothetical protein
MPLNNFTLYFRQVNTSTVVGRVDIDANGYVFGANYSNIWSNLSGISFVVD